MNDSGLFFLKILDFMEKSDFMKKIFPNSMKYDSFFLFLQMINQLCLNSFESVLKGFL